MNTKPASPRLPPPDLVGWLVGIPEKLRASLARVGLVPQGVPIENPGLRFADHHRLDALEALSHRHRLDRFHRVNQAHRIIRRAGLTPWPRTFQNLRASRESELMRDYDLATACRWIGNSPAVAARH